MKEYITMKKTQSFDIYKSLEAGDVRFIVLWNLLSDDFLSGQLLDWFHDENRTIKANEWFEMYKEDGVIALYDTSDRMSDETIFDLDPLKRFEMSRKNFEEVLHEWEELRISRPDTILIVIHEDNHVSLETDLEIIKEYQDAGYAFDINKVQQSMKEYTCFDRGIVDNYLSYSGLKSVGSQICCLQEFISQTYFPNRPRASVTSIYKYHDKKTDMLYIGYYDELQGRLNPIQFKPPLHELGDYINDDNSCKMSAKNFIACTAEWLAIEESKSPFALMFRDEHDWIHCQAFESQKEMEQFMINYGS